VKTTVKLFISVVVMLSLGYLPSSVNQHRDIAFWHVKHTPDSILISYYRFIDDFNAQLNSLTDATLYLLAINAVTDAQFAWALRLLTNDQAQSALPFWQSNTCCLQVMRQNN
jgi:hypothetical protein